MFFDHPSNPDPSDMLGDSSDEDASGGRAESELAFFAERFGGTAPLFPLGNLTLLPHVVQPFHMFEPRYRQLAEDAVEGDGFIALGVLDPTGTASYESKSTKIFPHVCLGKIMQYEPLPEGRWNLIVRGLWRAEVTDEVSDGLVGSKLYRQVELDVRDETFEVDLPPAQVTVRREALIGLFTRVQPKLAANPVIEAMLDREMPLGLLTDFVAHALDLSPTAGASLLREVDPLKRCQFLEAMLAAHLKATSHDDRPFPPEFSVN